MPAMWRRPAHLLGALVVAQALIDEKGQYLPGMDVSNFLPKLDFDEQVAAKLSKQPPEKLFRLLAWELSKEDALPQERFLSFGEFHEISDLNCRDRLLYILKLATEVSDDIKAYHFNVTSTAGIYWMLHEYPGETSWIWLLTNSHQRIAHSVNLYLSKLSVLALDRGHCITDAFRVVLMDAAARWKKVFGDLAAMLWNGFAFSVYGDVTSWREADEGTDVVNDGPGGAPSNVTWTENLIFGNMWASSVQAWLEYHAQVVTNAVLQEIPRVDVIDAAPSSHFARRMHHQGDAGMFTSFEYLRRMTFGQWALDKGLLRALIRHVWRPSYDDEDALVSVADFGAGGGRYSEWLNDTGLVHAFAFDGTSRVAEISGGKVQEVNLAADMQLWRTFDWVLSLEVAEHVPKKHAPTLLKNLRNHAQRGLVMSWSDDWEGIGHVNCLSREDFVATVENATGFTLDAVATEAVRRSCDIDYIARTIAVFRAP